MVKVVAEIMVRDEGRMASATCDSPGETLRSQTGVGGSGAGAQVGAVLGNE